MFKTAKAIKELHEKMRTLSQTVYAQATKNGENSSEIRLIRVEQQSRWDMQYQANNRHEAQMKELWALLADKEQNQ